ncbi:MAG: protein-tyrosine phosphatase [bacterium]|nr:MAG: protein-tyrosine phosphatase [bacterium]
MRDGLFQILAICTGNICRSPMAEGLIRVRLSARAAEFATVGSAGIAAVPGVPASVHSVEACRRHDIDIRSHRSSPLTKAMIEDADLLLVMEEHHRAAILRADPGAIDRTFLISEYALQGEGPGLAFGEEKAGPGYRSPGIDDPIGQDIEAYLDVFGRLDDYITRAMPRIEASVDSSFRR